MADRLRVVSRTFSYPADAASRRLVREAGGLSKLSAEARARVRMKTVGPGDWCDDMPAESVALRLARGEIARVPTAGPTATRRKAAEG